MTKSWLVRRSLELALRKQPPAVPSRVYDLARDLAGAVKELPEDLADNPNYVEWFWPGTLVPVLMPEPESSAIIKLQDGLLP